MTTMLRGVIRSDDLLARLVLMGCALLAAPTAGAGPITITNNTDSTVVFDTDVKGSVSHFPPFFQNHVLVDIPDTPWVSSSKIFESAGLTADSVSVTWTIEHILGPHPTDVNPNPNEPVTLGLSFTAAAAGAFSVPSAFVFIDHPLTTGDHHFDELRLGLFGTVTAGLLGHLNITAYTVRYFGQHCPELDATGVCVFRGPGIGEGGFVEAPEPGTPMLLCLGLLALIVSARSSRLFASQRRVAGSYSHAWNNVFWRERTKWTRSDFYRMK